MVVNFAMVSDLQLVLRRDFAVADTTILDPNGTNPLYDGEFLTLDASYKLIRAVSGQLAWCCFSERGRYDVQSLKKATVLFGNTYEADTRVFTSGGITLLCALECDEVTLDTKTKAGLVVKNAGSTIGYCTRTSDTNGGKLRFIQTLV